jgi:hypothetical protein
VINSGSEPKPDLQVARFSLQVAAVPNRNHTASGMPPLRPTSQDYEC